MKDAQGNDIPEGGEVKFTPEQQAKVDSVVQERLARERAKYSNYDELLKFKTDHEKTMDQAKQKELEDQKKYDELKQGWLKKEEEYKGIITKKDTEIVDMTVGSSLMTEIVKQNAYAEEAMALIRQQAVYDPVTRVVTIKGKDANGVEKYYSVEEGVKEFLKSKPHLVKANKPGGGGTPPGGSNGGGATGGDDLNTLNALLIEARNKGDRKAVGEITSKIRAKMHSGRPAV